MSQRQLEGYVCMYACMCVIFIRCDRRTSNNKHKKTKSERRTMESRRKQKHRVCSVLAARAASACHWNWSAVGDDKRPTEGDSRLRGTREPLQRATDA